MSKFSSNTKIYIATIISITLFLLFIEKNNYFIFSFFIVSALIVAYLILKDLSEVMIKINNVKVVGIGGEKEVGKSTAANYFEDHGYYHTYFAKALKEICKTVFNLTEAQVSDTQQKEDPLYGHLNNRIILNRGHVERIFELAPKYYPSSIPRSSLYKALNLVVAANGRRMFNTPRQILQYVGTEILRECIHPDFHALCLDAEIRGVRSLKGITRFVVSDARFENERKFIRERYNGVLILLKNPKPTDNKDRHASETSLGKDSEYDFVFTNDKSMGLQPLHQNLAHLLLETN